jgi:hypothetical protein
MQRALQEIARGPAEGRKIHVFGVVLTVRIASMDTGGDYVDEAFQILEGRMKGFRIPQDIKKLMEMAASHGHAFIGPPL